MIFGKKNIFISHSSKNKEIAEQLCAYFSRYGLDNKRVFCSSIIGQGVSNGEKLNEAIGAAFSKSHLLIYLLSKDFIDSSYCMEELGVGWYMAQRKKAICFYLVLPDIELSELNGFVNSKIDKFTFVDQDHRDDLGLFAIDVAKALRMRKPSHEVILNANNTFFSSTNAILSEIKTNRENEREAAKRAEERRKQLEIDCKEQVDTIEKLRKTVEENRKEIEELSKVKASAEQKDSRIEALRSEILKEREATQTKLRKKEYDTITSIMSYFGLCSYLAKELYHKFQPDFWIKNIERYIELSKEFGACSYTEMVCSIVYSINGDYSKAYEHLLIYVKEHDLFLDTDFLKKVHIEDDNDMHEIVALVEEKLARKPYGNNAHAQREVIRFINERNKRIREGKGNV